MFALGLALGVVLLPVLPSVRGAEKEPQMRTIAKGAFSGMQEPAELVITNKTQWAEIWKRHSAQGEPKKEAPDVDFTKETVLFVSAGRKSTGGYGVEISGFQTKSGKTEVMIIEKKPRPGGLNIQALTAPFHIVAVPAISGEVKFRRE
jgi:hypothetical protein